MADVLILSSNADDVPSGERMHVELQELGVSAELRLANAYRTPEHLRELVIDAEQAGTKIFICADSGSASLATAVAALTIRPVIGIPLSAGALGGVDALYSTCNTPAGIPVATVGVGAWGLGNAATLAAEMLAIGDEALSERLRERRTIERERMLKQDQALQDRLNVGVEA